MFSQSTRDGVWFAVDSGADHHFLSRDAKELLGEMCGDVKALVVATGDAKIEVEMGLLKPNSLGIQGRVAYSSEIKYSLISVSVLVKAGWGVTFGVDSALVDPEVYLLLLELFSTWILIQYNPFRASNSHPFPVR